MISASRLLLYPVDNPNAGNRFDAYALAEDAIAMRDGVVVRIPAGFEFDGASIPRFAWSVIGSPFHPRLMTASVFHDWLYYTHQLGSRLDADDWLLRLMLRSGVGAARANTIYSAVRAFGGGYYENDDDDLAYLDRLRAAILSRGQSPDDYGLVEG